MKTTKILVVALFMGMSIARGQSLSDLVKEAGTLYEKTRNELVFPKTQSFLSYQHFYTQLDTNRNVNFWQARLKNIEASQYKKDIGLVFKANAQYNLRNGFDEELNNFTIVTIRSELEWNILRSGYTNNRAMSQRRLSEEQILINKASQKERELMRRQFRIDYTYNINLESIQFFEKFLEFENAYFDYLNKLYFKKYIKRERLIKASHQINILKNQIEIIKNQNEVLKDSVSSQFQGEIKLPFLRLKMDSLLLKTDTENLMLQQKNIELQHKAINDLNFSLYVQESFTQLKNGHRFFPSVGIRFRAPIRFNHRKKIIEIKKKILTAQAIDKSLGKYNRMITTINGYNEKLKDVQNQHKNWKRVEERIRILSVLKSELQNEETGTLILELLEEEFKIMENMLQLKRQLYTILSHAFELNENTSLNDLIEPIRFEKITDDKRFAIKKSSLFSLDYQITFLKAKGGNEVEVLEGDLPTQKALMNAKVKWKKVKEFSCELTEKVMQRELTQIQSKL